MIIEASITINASKAAAWAATTDVARFAELLSGVQKIEIIERPAGLVGLKWKETRMLFGQEATVEKWITEAQENAFYTTRAEQDGFVFITTNRVSGSDGSVTLTGIHETQPQGIAAKVKALPMVFFKGVIRKAITQDLKDIKVAVEQPPGVTRFRKLNEDWNAEPNAPVPSAHIEGRDVVLSFFANHFIFDRFREDQRLTLRFTNARRYRIGSTNGEGWYRGQCRFSGVAPDWGEFYELSGDLRLDQSPKDWQSIADDTPPRRHFLFYLRDATFECEAEDWSLVE